MSSIWMHRRSWLKSFFKIFNKTHNILIYVASQECWCWWRPSMVVVCQLQVCYPKFEWICHPYGCIEEVGRVKLSMWSYNPQYSTHMWPADDASDGEYQLRSQYVNYRCSPASLSGYVIHMDAQKRSDEVIEVFGPYSTQYTHRCGQQRVPVWVQIEYGVGTSTTVVILQV